MALKLDMIGPGVEALRREVRNHQKLLARVKQAIDAGERMATLAFEHTDTTDIPVIRNFSEWVGFLAAEVGILVSGTYTPTDIDNLCGEICLRLQQKRTLYIHNNTTPRQETL